MTSRSALILASILPILCGCQSAAQHAADVRNAQAPTSNLTLGTVQREIHVGMTGAQVIAVLGAPNMVTSDGQHRETWVYDRISTDSVVSGSSGGGSLIFLGAFSTAGARSTTQKTLTIIIKFDGSGRVRDFSYRASSF